MRTTHEQTAGARSPDGPAGPVSRPGCEMTAAEPTAAPDGGRADVLPFPELLRTGPPLDWRAVLARLAPIRRRWDLAILATLDRDIGFPSDLLEVIKTNWPSLGPKIGHKLNVYVGDMDSYYLNDAVENLVLADRCNGDKSDHLAGARHLDHWTHRLRTEGSALAGIAGATRWPTS